MKLDFYKPKSQLLQKYIEKYYFVSADNNARNISYKTFPNNWVFLTTNQNITVETTNNEVTIAATSEENIITCIVSQYIAPMQIHYKELVNELTICFKPLGINQFLENTNDIFSKQMMIDFSFLPDYNEFVKELFKLSKDKQHQALENYLLSKLLKKDFSLIQKILIDIESDAKIKDISEKYKLSRQYLNRIFKKHIGKSLSEYRKIHRFRNSLMMQKESENFTQLSHVDFYDQSHFIRNFKELTEINPNLFFKNVDVDKDNIWLFT